MAQRGHKNPGHRASDKAGCCERFERFVDFVQQGATVVARWRNNCEHSEIEDDALTIPQYETHGSMGRGLILRDQPGVIHSWRVNPEWVQKNVRSASSTSNLCIVTGFGDSMRPLYNPGDPLLVDRGVSTVEFDAIYFFRVGEEGFIKRLQRIPGLGLMALSENKSYRDWTITEDMDFQLFGRVLKIWKGEDF